MSYLTRIKLNRLKSSDNPLDVMRKEPWGQKIKMRYNVVGADPSRSMVSNLMLVTAHVQHKARPIWLTILI